MIRFKCLCGVTQEVPAELAGTSIQCPDCKRLVDIPLLSDLAQMEADGTLRIEPASIKQENRDEELLRAYRPSRRDDDGNEYDLRTDFETIVNAGADERPLEEANQLRPGAPKYDPVTGELIEPLSIKAEAPQRVLPLNSTQQVPAAAVALEYHRGQAIAGQATPPSMLSLPLRLWLPDNLAVWVAVIFTHAVNLLFTIPMASRLAFLALAAWAPLMMIAAHYSNVVEDTGPMERDELPGMLRGLSFREDIFAPFCNLAGSLMLAYLPTVLVGLGVGILGLKALWLPAVIACGIIGTLVFPAVFLTLSTSGSLVNAAPHRVIGVIRACGPSYLLTLPLWLITLAIYGAGFWFSQVYIFRYFNALDFLVGRPKPTSFVPPLWASLPLIVLGIYLMHLLCWTLGRLYRTHHDRFPWLHQRHISQRRQERRIPRRPKPSAAGVVPPAPPQGAGQ